MSDPGSAGNKKIGGDGPGAGSRVAQGDNRGVTGYDPAEGAFCVCRENGMTGKRFEEMSEAEFETLVDGYIERTASGYGEIPVEHFLALLTERIAAKTAETVNLSIDVGDDDALRITPDREWSDIVIRGNEIWVGNRKLVLKLTERD